MVPSRVVLYMLSFSGFIVSFIMRSDINIAIVTMVKQPPPKLTDSKVQKITGSYCYLSSAKNISYFPESDSGEETKQEQGEFDWSPTAQSLVLGSFYWTYTFFQITSEYLTRYFGNKNVFGAGQLITAICCFLIPSAAELHYCVVIALRLVQGMASSVLWPTMMSLFGQWIPPNERSRFMSAFQGMSIGVGLTYLMYGSVIANYGWRAVFYISGCIGVIWCILWHYFVFETPAVHPKITRKELQHIQHSVKDQLGDFQKGKRVPWKAILASWTVWTMQICVFGRVWMFYSFVMSGPTYMKTILGFNIKANGFLSGVPHFMAYLCSLFCGYLADVLIKRQTLSITKVRKLFTFIGMIVPAILLILIGYMGCNIIPVLVFWFFAIVIMPASFAGVTPNMMEVSPNFSGQISAIGQTVSMPASFLSAMVVGFLTEEGATLGAWRIAFGLAALIGVGTCTVYFIYGTSNIQTWNFPEESDVNSTKEDVQPLNVTYEKKIRIAPEVVP